MDYNKMTPQEISSSLLDHIKNNSEGEPSAELLRCGIGLTLSAIHSVILINEGTEGAYAALQSIQSLSSCLENDIKTHNIEGVHVESYEVPCESEGETLQ